jgi:CDP-diacylglycerol--glycerol-3-phosphate 3-phosphatidyltransferase
VCSVAVPPLALLRGWWILLAAVLVALSALADSVDSGVALIARRTTGMGSFYDAVADRCSEILWLVALWLLGAPGPLVAACGAVAMLHEYARSRAALGGMARVGAITVAERPTRVLIVVGALLAGALGWQITSRLAAGIVTVALAIWLVLGVLGGARLVASVRRHLR